MSVNAGEILDLLPAGVCVCDTAGRIIQYNSRAVQLWGAEPRIGEDLQSFAERCKVFLPDGSPLSGEQLPIFTTLCEGREFRDVEVIVERPDGSRSFAGISTNAIRDAAGRLIGALAVSIDISERKRSEALRVQELARVQQLEAQRKADLEQWNAQLQEQIDARKAGDIAQLRLAAIVESSDDAIIGKTLEGIVTDWNRAAQSMFGYSAQEVVGKSILVLVPPELHALELDILARLRRGEHIDHFETQRVTRDGRRVDISLSISPIKDDAGTAIGASTIARDISDRKRIERSRAQLLEHERTAREEAQRVSQLKDEFLATLSHELRTPLNAILGWAQLLASGAIGPGEIREAAEVVARNARTQKQLIDDLLDMSRIVSGKLRLDVQQVDPVRVIEAAIDTVKPSADARGIRIDREFDPLAAPVNADPARMQQVMWNLLSNAVKFTPRGGTVRVTLGRVDSQIELTVSDTGQGIKPDFIPYLFKRFSQQEASANRKHGGLGLGLAIVKELVELHGGTVQASSAGEGKGATFTIRLPTPAIGVSRAGAAPSPAFQPSLLPENGRTDLSNIKILVVDDEQDARELIKWLLDRCGAQVVTAPSAMSALSLLESDVPDVLISDIGMPGLDGYEFLRTVRSIGRADIARVPAIALTAFARTEDRTRALRAGYIAHVAKPVEPSELIATIAVVSGRAATS